MAIDRFNIGRSSILVEGMMGLIRITINHCPEQRGQHKENADDAEDDGRMSEEQNLDHEQDQTRERRARPTSQPARPAR